jgi:hypothetical protein
MDRTRSHRIEILLGLLGTAIIVIALGLYIANEPGRIVSSQGAILNTQLDDAMTSMPKTAPSVTA